MNTKKLQFKIIAALIMISLSFGLSVTGPAQANQVPDKSNLDNSYQQIDRYIEDQLKALNIPGASLAVIEGDRIVHVQGFGVSGPEGKAPTAQTPFYICSLTKSFTALAVMQMVEAGKIDVEAPIQHYLPWFTLTDPQVAAQITVRHLLNQTSGFTTATYWKTLVNFDDSADATEKQARELATFKPNRPVGSKFEYSNTNYNLLGLIIEAASGEKYADYVQNHIFTPLSMTHTYTSKALARQNGLSSGYISWFGVPIAVPDLPIPIGSLPSGQIISSAKDMAHYLIAQLNGGRYGEAQILSAEGIAAMHSPATDATTMGEKMDYGMGWFVEPTSYGSLLWHDGTAPDFFSYMALLPEQNRGFVLLVNANEIVMNFGALASVGGEAASLLAGGKPNSSYSAVIPWVLRLFLIIPALQILDVLFTLRAIRRWRKNASRRPGPVRKWVIDIGLPVILNLVLVLCALYLVAGGSLRFWMLFMADLTWLALICGSFALVWIFVRSGLILRALGKPSLP